PGIFRADRPVDRPARGIMRRPEPKPLLDQPAGGLVKDREAAGSDHFAAVDAAIRPHPKLHPDRACSASRWACAAIVGMSKRAPGADRRRDEAAAATPSGAPAPAAFAAEARA